MNYIGVPYIYISKEKEVLENYLSSRKVDSKDLLKLSTGEKSFLSFSSEFRFSSSDSRSIIAILELLDADREFEQFFLKDSLTLSPGFGITYFMAFGINGDNSSIQALTLTNIIHNEDIGEARKIVMEFVTGEIGSVFDSQRYNIASTKATSVDDIKTQLLTSAIVDNPNGTLVGTEGQYLTSINEVYNNVIQNIVTSYTNKPSIVLLPDLSYHLKPIGLISEKFISLISAFGTASSEREKRKLTAYYNDLGFKTIPTSETNTTSSEVYSVNLGKFVTKERTSVTIDKKGKVDVAPDYGNTETKSTLKEDIDFLFSKLNDNSKYIFEREMLWISNPDVIDLLIQANDGTAFPQLQTEQPPKEVLVVGDFRVINSILYGAESNILLKKLTSNININEEESEEEQALLPNLELLARIKVGEEYLYNLLWKYFTKNRNISKDASVFRKLFSDNDLIKNYVTNALDTEGKEKEVEDIINTIPILRYNTENSNVLDMSLEKDGGFFASLMQAYTDLESIRQDVNLYYRDDAFKFNFFPNENNLDKLRDVLNELHRNKWSGSLSNQDVDYDLDSLVGLDYDGSDLWKQAFGLNTEDPKNLPLNTDIRKAEDIEKYILSKYNNLVYTAKVKTLPLFTFSSPDIVGTGLMGLIGNGLKTIGKYNLEVGPLDRMYTGLWGIFGYKHVISKSSVYSEFTLIRANNLLYNSGFSAEQL